MFNIKVNSDMKENSTTCNTIKHVLTLKSMSINCSKVDIFSYLLCHSTNLAFAYYRHVQT